MIIYVNGKQEYFRDEEEMLWYLKSTYNIDLSSLNLLKLNGLENGAKECVNELDQLGCEKEVELLEDIIDEINQLRLNKDKKSELTERIKDIIDGLDDHVEFYRQAALDSLEVLGDMYD